MKLCFECSEYPPGPHGGIGTLVQTIARGMVKAGHQVRVAGVYSPSYPAPDFECDEGVEVWRLRRVARRFAGVTARRRLFKLIQGWCHARDVDLIEVPDWGGPAAGWRDLPCPVVTRLSGSASFFAREMKRHLGKIEFLMERASLLRSQFVCSNSQYIGERTRAIFRLRSSHSVIYPPVEVNELTPGIQRDPHMVVFAGTLAEKKGVISLVKCWHRVQREFPQARLHIWGKDGKTDSGGSMQQYLLSLLPPPLQTSVQFHGHVPLNKLLAIFEKAGMVVLPSYAEGFALTPLHAMAAACFTIYSARGSGPELIANGENGILIDPDNSDQIAGAILTLLRSRLLADRMGERGRKLVEQRFAWSQLCTANEEFYRKCIKVFQDSRGMEPEDRLHAA